MSQNPIDSPGISSQHNGQGQASTWARPVGPVASMSFPSWSLSTKSFQASPQMSLMQSNLGRRHGMTWYDMVWHNVTLTQRNLTQLDILFSYWLVVNKAATPLKKIRLRQLGWGQKPNMNGKIKHVPNHQPGESILDFWMRLDETVSCFFSHVCSAKSQCSRGTSSTKMRSFPTLFVGLLGP